jgi:glycosyltransferase involved in cell wall biosynthesis
LPTKGWEQLVKCPWNILRRALKQPSDSIFHLHDSELLVVGMLLKLAGRKVVYDAHEDTPLQISYQHWIPSIVKPFYAGVYRLLEKAAGWWFDAIIVAEPVISKYFPSRKVNLIRNFPIASSFQRDVKEEARKNYLVYVGLLSKARGLEEMLEGHRLAAEQLPVELVLGGKFAPASLEQELLPKYRVQYRSWLSYHEMVELLSISKIGIIVPHPIERYKTNYPVKLFEYMAAGLPVIVAKDGESSKFVEEASSGILVDPLNPKEIGDAIIALMKDPAKAWEMGQRGKQLMFNKYNWERESEKLIRLYQSI